jgi:hypothetical protein
MDPNLKGQLGMITIPGHFRIAEYLTVWLHKYLQLNALR